MNSERTNLLPLKRQRAFRRDYFIRLSIATLLFFIALVVVAALLLVPTYRYLTQRANTDENRLTSIQTSLSSADEAALSARLAALSTSATTLEALAKAPSASGVIRALLAVTRPGITLTGINNTFSGTNGAGKLIISGVAATRDALQSYQLALQNLPFALSVNLPVSAYAKDVDISFSITITLNPSKTPTTP